MRRTARHGATSAPTPRRKPEWNAYLTDDARYKLNQRQQLQRQLQQLSTAHFSARSPSYSASRRRMEAASSHRSAWSTPRDLQKKREAQQSRSRSFSEVQDTGDLKVSRRLQFADVSMDQEEATPKKKSSVSFQESRMDPQHKASLQGELEVLERMLLELETETERQSWKTPQKSRVQTPQEKREQIELQEEEEEGYEEEQEQVTAESRLGDVCYKSLEIGMDLTRKMNALAKELEHERRLREDRDLKIEMLEQEVRSTQARCNYLDAKYQSVATQVDNMQEVVATTEEAIRRMTLAFEYSQRRRGKSSNPTTPSKPAATSRSHRSTDVKTAKKTKKPEQENLVPNRQRID